MTEYQGEITHYAPRPQMVFQDPYSSLNPAFSIRRIVEEPLRIFGKYSHAETRQRAEEMLTAVGLGPDFWDRKPRQLSGGQRQRVSIAAAMIVKPRLVILDEAVSELPLHLPRPERGLSVLRPGDRDAERGDRGGEHGGWAV
jgi:peptide/nickel transport system ATP-binding protein